MHGFRGATSLEDVKTYGLVGLVIQNGSSFLSSSALQSNFLPRNLAVLPGQVPPPGGRFAAPAPSQAPLVQLLDAQAKRVNDPDFEPLSSPEQATGMLREMVLMRRFDTEATASQRKGELGLWAPLLGQEAVQAGTFRALAKQDHVFPSHREHGLGMLMGLPLERMLAIFAGTQMSNWDPEQTSFHPYSMVIGAATLHGVGYAMGQARDLERGLSHEPGATVIFHGDGAISEGDVNEAYVFAAVYQAPAVFICVNNQWAISEPVERQSRIPLYQRAWGFGIPSLRVDGNDVLAMEAAITWALQRAHAGEGPSLIEAFTYRMGAHTTSDDPTKYRTKSELDQWLLKDPILRTETWLRAAGVWDDDAQTELDQQADELGEQVRALVKQLAAPKLPDVFDAVYAETTDNLLAQQASAALR